MVYSCVFMFLRMARVSRNNGVRCCRFPVYLSGECVLVLFFLYSKVKKKKKMINKVTRGPPKTYARLTRRTAVHVQHSSCIHQQVINFKHRVISLALSLNAVFLNRNTQ
jgi:hypothetical protein